MAEWSAGVAADHQYQELENTLLYTFLPLFLVNINGNYWQELDSLPDDTWDQLRDGIRDAFETTIARFRNNGRVLHIIDRIQHALYWGLRGYFAVPFPGERLDAHLDTAFTFILTTLTPFYAEFRTEMVQVNYVIHKIQTYWREANTNPAHLLCRRRLMHEYLETTNVLNACTGFS
jgi:hypothetical protein